MDIKDIIKWFIPSILSLLMCKFRYVTLTACLFLFLSGNCVNARTSDVQGFTESVNDILGNWTLEVNNMTELLTSFNRRHNADVFSELFPYNSSNNVQDFDETERLIAEDRSSAARTFGRPIKKMAMALIPLAFQMGVASTWMLVSSILSFKGLLVGLAILKLLLLGGAAKLGTLFAAHKHPEPVHHHQPWSPQKEVHLHIHNGHHPEETHAHSHTYEEYGSPWSRDGASSVPVTPAPVDPYFAYNLGPQTINTPYGSYVRVGPGVTAGGKRRR